MTAATRRARLEAAQLYLVATLHGVGEMQTSLAGLFARIAQAAAAGAPLVQLRAKQASTEARRAWLAELRPLLPRDALLLINDDLDAVFGLDGRPLADGVHLGRQDAAALLPIDSASSATAPTASTAPAQRVAQGLALARRRLGADLLLGTSARTLAEVDAAREAGADHVGFGAMADSASKLDTVRADPAELRRCLAALPRFPIFPIGGLHPGNLVLVREAGGQRAAVGGAILQADDPAAVVRECLQRLRDHERDERGADVGRAP